MTKLGFWDSIELVLPSITSFIKNFILCVLHSWSPFKLKNSSRLFWVSTSQRHYNVFGEYSGNWSGPGVSILVTDQQMLWRKPEWFKGTESDKFHFGYGVEARQKTEWLLGQKNGDRWRPWSTAVAGGSILSPENCFKVLWKLYSEELAGYTNYLVVNFFSSETFYLV